MTEWDFGRRNYAIKNGLLILRYAQDDRGKVRPGVLRWHSRYDDDGQRVWFPQPIVHRPSSLDYLPFR